jgi:hypothetical protein
LKALPDGFTSFYQYKKESKMLFARGAFFGNVFFGVTLLLALPSFLTGQSEKCSDSDLVAVLQPTDQAYSMAMELAETLQAEGFIIKCMLRSKMEGAFEGQYGAALFRTNRGDFEAMFLSKQKTFEKMKVLERRENGWYFYSFEGDPNPRSLSRMESPRRKYFVKHAHLLLLTSNDLLAEDLRQAVSKH